MQSPFCLRGHAPVYVVCVCVCVYFTGTLQLRKGNNLCVCVCVAHLFPLLEVRSSRVQQLRLTLSDLFLTFLLSPRLHAWGAHGIDMPQHVRITSTRHTME